MSRPRGGGLGGVKVFGNIANNWQIDCNFIVDSTNGNGLGIRSLKSNGYVNNIFMHTSSTPGTNNGTLNPNPAVGYAVVQMKNNFNSYLGGFTGIVSQLTGSQLTSTTAGLAYVITALGTTTLAQWQAAGLQVGFVPAVGAAFIAKATGAIGGNGTVQVPGVSGIAATEIVGDPNQTIANSALLPNSGSQFIVQFLGASGAGTTTLIPTAPPNGATISLNIKFDGSSVTIDGL